MQGSPILEPRAGVLRAVLLLSAFGIALAGLITERGWLGGIGLLLGGVTLMLDLAHAATSSGAWLVRLGREDILWRISWPTHAGASALLLRLVGALVAAAGVALVLLGR